MKIFGSDNKGDLHKKPTETPSGSLQGRNVSNKRPPGADRVPMPAKQSKANIPIKSFTANEFIQALENNENFDNIIIKIKGFVMIFSQNSAALQAFSRINSPINIDGSLILTNCTELTSLPEYLSIDGDCILDGCTGLSSLPEKISVRDYFILDGCTGLTSLPDNLSIDGNLDLNGCTGLTTLPEKMRVGNFLTLDGCTSLTSLPESLSFGGNLSLNNCTGLTSLPSWITEIGICNNGYERNIHIRNTGLSDEIIQKLRDAPAPGMNFI